MIISYRDEKNYNNLKVNFLFIIWCLYFVISGVRPFNNTGLSGLVNRRRGRKDGGGNDCMDRVYEVPAKFAGIQFCDDRANLAILF